MTLPETLLLSIAIRIAGSETFGRAVYNELYKPFGVGGYALSTLSEQHAALQAALKRAYARWGADG